MDRHAGDHQRDAEKVAQARDLRQHDRADDGRGCRHVTGEDCFIVRVQVRSVADLERVIDRIIPYAMTNTAVIQSSPVPARLPTPAATKG